MNINLCMGFSIYINVYIMLYTLVQWNLKRGIYFIFDLYETKLIATGVAINMQNTVLQYISGIYIYIHI